MERWEKEHSELLERLADQRSLKRSWGSFFDLPKADPDYLPADRGTRADTEVRLVIADFFLKTARGTPTAQQVFDALIPPARWEIPAQ
ncbi:hypothetical protein [Pseudomonas spirodelae]|uniref:Uncharacterized protein n=1 Tax=Pseudomonas spirodelae TaxID=3101751 RepID=A0ABU5P7G0_9PSED|nr:hypothetical protein [Pseudomonas sp. T5W1]MEA1605599.1 hypothetical protein [Pseudomonas sp. T5W1]